jgi:hypothetical protein
VYDNIIDNERRHRPHGLLASLNMLIDTPAGFEFTERECSDWMREAGFTTSAWSVWIGSTRRPSPSNKPASRGGQRGTPGLLQAPTTSTQRGRRPLQPGSNGVHVKLHRKIPQSRRGAIGSNNCRTHAQQIGLVTAEASRRRGCEQAPSFDPSDL